MIFLSNFESLLLNCFSIDLDQVYGIKKYFSVLFKKAPSAIFYLFSFTSNVLTITKVEAYLLAITWPCFIRPRDSNSSVTFPLLSSYYHRANQSEEGARDKNWP